MPTLTVTQRGQVTFRKEVLKHLGVEAGDKIEINLLPGGQAAIAAQKRAGTIENFIGCLAGKSKVAMSLEDMDEVARKGWAGEL